MRYLLFSLIFLLSTETILAQKDSLPSRFNSPYEVIYNHLKYLQEDTYLPGQAAKSLSRSGFSEEELENLSIELKQIFDGSGSYIYLDEVPRSNDYFDSTISKNRYILFKEFPDVYVQKEGGQWLYASKTVQQIDQIHKTVYPFGTDKLLNLLPKIGSRKFVGLHLWQLAGGLIIITIAFTLHFVLTIILKSIIFKLLHHYGKVDLANNLILPVAKPFSLLLVFAFVSLLIPTLQLPIAFSKYLILALNALLPLFATVFFYKMVDILGAYLKRVAEKSENTLDDQLVPLVRKILKTFVVLVGFIAILKGLKFDIWPLITGLSIGGLAVALAAQDTLKNFFGSVMIFIDRPFQIGDWITSDEVDGTVEEVGFRSTRIRTFRDSVMYVPNSVISNRTVDNHGRRQYRRYFTKLAITYDTPANLIEVFVQGIEKIVLNHPETRKDYYNIFLNEYGASSLDVMLYVFFKVPSWNDELRCRQEIMLSVNRLAEQLGVRFAFPTQTMMVEQFPGKMSLTPNYNLSKEEMKKQMEAFFIDNQMENGK
ncbi:MAG: mechanosensitive ion channel protein [Cytophagales bacterium CG12_big_fil_rev_8_21_14_0_65_40_12]|nr:MAG: mechanosensitive ion channel protein [Cytophagales bacterium CG12_big_fil_rev_8_21_14_0_65_40_12]PIW05502.1 MAG: mechanosensitive ion channel protein [Cytophagales bacterium CG17_big_fil_post_rev_8_21_14_2_50_40_13]